MLKAEAEEEESRRLGNNAASVSRKAVGAENRQIDPLVVRLKTGAPDDDLGLDNLPAAQREAIPFILQTRKTRDSGITQLPLRNSDQRVTALSRPCAHSTAQTCL